MVVLRINKRITLFILPSIAISSCLIQRTNPEIFIDRKLIGSVELVEMEYI
jgi:hypothetical protein